ncbi:MAG: cytochrome c biogenesis protein CcsA [Gammaproteobacteria bacterium]|nr:cytochrome c biogenesis protein CcsA [Gammaproteobacteria bacterium]
MEAAILILLTLTAYLGLSDYLALGLLGRVRTRQGIVLAVGALAVALHAALLHLWIDTPAGQNLSFFNMASMMAWLISLLLLATLPFRQVGALLAMALPVAALSVLLVPLVQDQVMVDYRGREHALWHVFASIAAYSMLAIAAVQALVLAILDHRLRHKKPGRPNPLLPPLTSMESFLFHLIGLGFALLSLSLATGWLYLGDAPGMRHKMLLSVVAWLVFGTLLAGRAFRGWRGRTAIRLTLAGFGLLVLAYFGTKLVLEFIL